MEHRYKLMYITDETTVTVEFDGNIHLITLQDNLRNFLAGAGWGESNLAKLFGEGVE